MPAPLAGRPIEAGTILTDLDPCASVGGHDMNQTLGQVAGSGCGWRSASAVATTVTLPSGALVGVLLYLDLGARNDRLDLDTLRADLPASTA